MPLIYKHILTLITITLPIVAVFGQNDFTVSLKKNLSNYNPQYIEAKISSPVGNEHLYPKVIISEEPYTLTQNAISYYDAISSLPEETKMSMLKAYSEIAYAAEKSGLASYPDELLWLPFAISAFGKEYELDGNCGVWGLQYLYAIKYGVEISECTEGRHDIMQSTPAAIRQLQYLHDKFGKWDEALAAASTKQAFKRNLHIARPIRQEHFRHLVCYDFVGRKLQKLQNRSQGYRTAIRHHTH